MRYPDLSQRSQVPEIIDAPGEISDSEWRVILRELRLVNRWLGGLPAALGEIQLLVRKLSKQGSSRRPIRIVDLGSGSADIPLALAAWAKQRGYRLQVLAVDLSSSVCRVAQHHTRRCPEVTILQGDVRHSFLKEGSYDLVLCSAFLHHFSDQEISELLKNWVSGSTAGVVISDLHRNLLAYLGIRFLTGLLSRSRAIRHDGPLSVLKGFRRKELLSILERTGVRGARLKWRWAFRWVVVIPKG